MNFAERVVQLEALRELERQRLEPVGGAIDCFNDSELHEYLTLRTGINTMTARIKWCDETLERIRNQIKQKSRRAKSKKERRR